MANEGTNSGIFISAASLRRRSAPHKTIVLNPRPGSGKTTLSTNLVSACARRGMLTLLVDGDPRGSACAWLARRPAGQQRIDGIHYSDGPVRHETWIDAGQLPPDCRQIVVDLPAGLPDRDLYLCSHIADTILIPVIPSQIDVRAMSRLIAQLIIDGQISRSGGKIGVVANRVRSSTKSFQMLTAFLTRLRIPLVAIFRDSSNFEQASGLGLGVCDMPAYQARDDASQVNAVIDWTERWRECARARSVAEGWKTASETEPVRPKP